MVSGRFIYKGDIAKHISDKMRIGKNIVFDIINETFSYMEDRISKGDTVVIYGFGKFKKKSRCYAGMAERGKKYSSIGFKTAKAVRIKYNRKEED